MIFNLNLFIPLTAVVNEKEKKTFLKVVLFRTLFTKNTK